MITTRHSISPSNLYCPMEPTYTIENCKFSAPLQWSVTVFWKDDEPNDAWLPSLSASLEPDGIRLLNHRFTDQKTSQFALSTLPHLAPQIIVQRVKGRLSYCVRNRKNAPFQRNFSLRSIGNTTRQMSEQYVLDQLGHHQMADPAVQARLASYQIVNNMIDLAAKQYTSHGIYWYNLHVVIVLRERWCEVRHEKLAAIRSTALAVAKKWNCRLSTAGILPDHIHLVIGCPFDLAPASIALSYLNNFAFIYDMKAMYQFGAFIGTVGEYTNKAIR